MSLSLGDDAAPAWSVDVRTALEASRHTAAKVAFTAILLALIEAAALASMFPLQRHRVALIDVDRSTGYVASPAQLDDLASTSVSSRLAIYVIARESREDKGRRYLLNLARSWSQGAALVELDRPTRTLGIDLIVKAGASSSKTDVVVTGVHIDTPTAADVRFQTTRFENGVSTEASLKWVAHLAFETQRTRGVRSALGLIVTKYVKAAETAGGAQ